MNCYSVLLTFDTDSYSANWYSLTFNTHLSNCFISHLRLSVRVQSVRAFTMAHSRLAIVNGHTLRSPGHILSTTYMANIDNSLLLKWSSR